MEALATYLMKSSVWLTGFALVYALFLRNERFFTLNRIYLVSGMLFSMIFPLFTWHYTVLLPLVPSVEISEPQVQGIIIPEESFNPQYLLLLAYLAGIFYLSYRILRQTLPVFRIIRKSEKRLYSSAKLIRTDAYPASFSFFSFVFVNPSIDETETNEIVNHELEHIRQQHWIDLLLFEILRTMQWFNPVCWLYGHLIRQNHEYLADERALQRSSNPAIYRAALLNQLFGGPVISLANSFNYSLNKKRFNMMKQTISSPIRKLKLLMVVPLIAGVFYAFAAPEYKFTQSENTNVVPKVKTISGKVIAEDGKPLKGASILVVEGGIGTVTDANGNFKLEVPDDMPLAISYVGFETQKVLPDFGKEKVIIMKSKTFSIKLDSPNSKDPKKVQEDLNQTNALIIVDGKEIAKVEMEKIKPETIESISVLKGESAAKLYGEKGKDGVILVTLKNDGQTPQILKVQSNSPLKFGNPDGSGSQPMIVKDGLIVKSQDVNNIPPENIESINVLKGEKAISKYGQKGSSGVVEIWTKKDNAKDVKSASEPIPFTITGNSTNSTDQANSVIEGFGKKPLVVIDGVISDIQSPDKVPSDSIASISILKGESAISKYGEKGKNGVMEIKTKKVIVGNSSKIGNINWVNNTVFSLAELNKVLRMQKGDQYSKEILNRRIWTDMDGVSSIYLDKGYVFSKIDIAETPVNDGTVNLTFTVYEGNRGKIGKIDIKGNKKVSTDDIRHKIVIKPGDLFSKTKIVQSVEALSKMSKLDPEAINPGVIPGSKIPNSEFINVDLVFNVTEK